jgi:hypothetical protein
MRLKILMILSLLNLLSNCAIGTPFAKSSKINDFGLKPETQVTIAITEVDIEGASSSNRSTFWDRVSSVRSSLDSNKGYLGGAIRREIFGSRAWTMTTWINEEALEQFVESREHERAMKEGEPAVKKAKFYRGKRAWSEIPLDWKEAERLIDEEGRSE